MFADSFYLRFFFFWGGGGGWGGITSGLDEGVKMIVFSEMYSTFNLYALSIKFKDYEAAQICENVRISPVCTYISIYVRNTGVITI